jgi:hypothetical protein
MWGPKVISRIGITLLVLCLLGTLTYCGLYQVQDKSAQVELERAATRIGVEPSYSAIGEYIVAHIVVGMSHDQVEQVLDEIAPLEIVHGPLEDKGLKWGPTVCDLISMKLGPQPLYAWRISACYNNKDELVILKSLDPDSFPPLDIYAP